MSFASTSRGDKALSVTRSETSVPTCLEAHGSPRGAASDKGPEKSLSLWLGHANMLTTEIYTPVDPSVKLEVLESIVAPKLRSRRFKATDKLISSLKPRTFMRTR